MRAQICARIFCKVYTYALAESVMRTNKLCPTTRTEFVNSYRMGICHFTSFTISVLKPLIFNSALKSTFSPVNGLMPTGLY